MSCRLSIPVEQAQELLGYVVDELATGANTDLFDVAMGARVMDAWTIAGLAYPVVPAA